MAPHSALNKGRGNIPPPRTSSACCDYVIPRSTKGGGIFPLQEARCCLARPQLPVAQQREGEYSPSKRVAADVSSVRPDRSTKGGGIFPLQGLTGSTRACRRAALNKGRGNIPPPRGSAQATMLSARSAQQREGEYSPSKDGCTEACKRSDSAQQREGEYSPSKQRGTSAATRTARRSTKGGGIFPLQGRVAADVSSVRPDRSTKGGGIFPLQGRPPAGSQPAAPHAQQREGEYSPSKILSADVDTYCPNAQQREGEYSPSKALRTQPCPFGHCSLNKGRGNIPPPRSAVRCS